MPATSSLVRILFDQVFTQGDLALVDELVSVDSPTHIPGWGTPSNRVGLKQMIANLRAAFPDLICMVEDEIEGDHKSAALWTLRGTHQGSFFGNLPTGRRIEVQGFIFARTDKDKMIETWLLMDQMSILQQLGVVPPPRSIGTHHSPQ